MNIPDQIGDIYAACVLAIIVLAFCFWWLTKEPK